MNYHGKVSPSDCETEQKLMVADRGMQVQVSFFKNKQEKVHHHQKHAMHSEVPLQRSAHFMQQTMKTTVNTVNLRKKWMD